jgi:hypothetical protein
MARDKDKVALGLTRHLVEGHPSDDVVLAIAGKVRALLDAEEAGDELDEDDTIWLDRLEVAGQ